MFVCPELPSRDLYDDGLRKKQAGGGNSREYQLQRTTFICSDVTKHEARSFGPDRNLLFVFEKVYLGALGSARRAIIEKHTPIMTFILSLCFYAIRSDVFYGAAGKSIKYYYGGWRS